MASTLERDSLAGAKWTAVSRASGFVRTAAIGAALGATWLGNIFQVANQLPWFLYELLLGSLLASLFVPSLVAARQRSGRELSRLTGTLVGVVALGFGVLSLLAAAASPLIARFVTSGVDVADQADARRATIVLLVLTAPQLAGYALIATLAAVQNAVGRFAFPAAIPVAENVLVVAVIGLYWALFPSTRTELAAFDTSRQVLLGLGSSAAVAAHLALSVWGVRRAGIRIRPNLDWHRPEVRRIATVARDSAGVALLGGVRVLAMLVVAATVEGGVVVLQFAQAFVNLPIALVARPIGTALIRQLSELLGPSERAGWVREYRSATLLNLAVLIPAAVGLAAFAVAIADAVSFGALGEGDGTLLLAVSLAALAPSVVGDGGMIVALQAAYSRADAGTVLRAFVLRAAGVLIGVAASFSVDGAARLAVAFLAVGLTDMVSAVALHQWSVGRWTPLALRRTLLRVALVASLAIALPAAVLLLAGDGWTAPPTGIPVVAAAGLVGLGAYIATERRHDPLRTLSVFGGWETDHVVPVGVLDVDAIDPVITPGRRPSPTVRLAGARTIPAVPRPRPRQANSPAPDPALTGGTR